MKTDTIETASQKNSAVLQLRRSMLPVDEYMTREGISRSVVEEYRQLGIVQIRKHAGRIYVIDLPLEPYAGEPEFPANAEESPRRAVQTQERSELLEEPADNLQTPKQSEKSANRLIAVIKLFGKLRRQAKTTDKPIEIPAQPDESTVEPVQTSSEEPDKVAAKPNRLRNTIVRLISIVQSLKTMLAGLFTLAHKAVGNRLKGLSSLTQSLKTIRSRLRPSETPGRARIIRAAAVFLLLLLFEFALIANMWLYTQHRNQKTRIEHAYAGLNIGHNRYAQARLIQGDLDDFTAEIELLRNELHNSQEQVQRLRNELAQARRNIDSIRQKNTQILEQLNKQITNLKARPRKLNIKP